MGFVLSTVCTNIFSNIVESPIHSSRAALPFNGQYLFRQNKITNSIDDLFHENKITNAVVYLYRVEK